jgi:hypothetical protein
MLITKVVLLDTAFARLITLGDPEDGALILYVLRGPAQLFEIPRINSILSLPRVLMTKFILFDGSLRRLSSMSSTEDFSPIQTIAFCLPSPIVQLNSNGPAESGVHLMNVKMTKVTLCDALLARLSILIGAQYYACVAVLAAR